PAPLRGGGQDRFTGQTAWPKNQMALLHGQDCRPEPRTACQRVAAAARCRMSRGEEIASMPSTASTLLPRAAPAFERATLTQRRFGKTEERVPVLGLGT